MRHVQAWLPLGGVRDKLRNDDKMAYQRCPLGMAQLVVRQPSCLGLPLSVTSRYVALVGD